ncbi:MAG: hypothetical protein M1840_004340 [Geoglossum simile]|nr:MAG: hypothetical protein M1840_004340 [Geoglossum simile]
MPPPSATRIDDLCEILRRKIQTTCCLGFIDDQPWQHHMYSVTRHTPGDRRPASLQEIVYREDSTYLSIKDKCTIALTLASAVLQLHDTPWLSECWGMNDIHLITGGVSLIDQPYVSRSFAPTLGSQQSPQPRSRHFVQNEMIFALGIALLELSYGQPILSLKTAGDLDSQGNETNFTEFSIASRLIEAINTRELPNYAKVVVRCIRCNFDTFICSLDNDEFRERFYQGVIVPLQKDYEYATSTSGP